MLRLLFSRQWWWTTLLVIAAVGVMARLGVWQFDRLAARRAFNARVLEQQAQPPLNLSGAALGADLAAMEYRAVVVVGQYDFSQQVALRNQAWDDREASLWDGRAALRPGIHLLTPLVLDGSKQAVLVDRGWIPLEDTAPENWGKYDEPGLVEVRGILRRSQSKPDFGGVPDPAGHLLMWNLANVERIAEQVSPRLLPTIYIQQSPDPASSSVERASPSVERASPSAGLPYRSQPKLDLSEGSHLGYAIQWFSFALLLGIGYPFYVRNMQRAQVKRASRRSTALSEESR